MNRHIGGNFYSYRLAVPYLYLIVSDEPDYLPHPTRPHCTVPNPTLLHLVTVDVFSGKILQDFSLGSEKLEDFRIEDMDEEGLLLSNSNHELRYFERTG